MRSETEALRPTVVAGRLKSSASWNNNPQLKGALLGLSRSDASGNARSCGEVSIAIAGKCGRGGGPKYRARWSPVQVVNKTLQSAGQARGTDFTGIAPRWVTKTPSESEIVDGWPNRSRLDCHAFPRSCGPEQPGCRHSHPSKPRRGEACFTAPTAGVEPQRQEPCSPQLRPAFLGLPECDVVTVDEGVGDRPTANSRPLASGRISTLLALAIATVLGSHAEGS